MSSTVLGLDLGGTKIEAVVARRTPFTMGPSSTSRAPNPGALQAPARALEVLTRRRVPTPAAEGYEAVLEATAKLVEASAEEAGLDPRAAPIGIGMPGGTTRRGGLVKNANAVCLNGRPFRADLARRLGRPFALDNDANCFALAETLLGAARPHAGGVVFGVILGTGVGGGVVARGEVWEGAQGIAGEWGHHAVWADRAERPCYCGRAGCLEQWASGPAVEADYAARAGARRPLAEIARRRGEDPHAAAAIESLVDAFGRGIANVIDILDPSAIVLGGGVSNLDLLYDEGAARVARYVFNDELTTPILRHALGDSAGVLGAALIATR
jgi:fructokinase